MNTGANEYGVVRARWGHDVSHDGETCELHLCEACFFQTIANIKQERRSHTLSSEGGPYPSADLGLITNDGYFGDSDY